MPAAPFADGIQLVKSMRESILVKHCLWYGITVKAIPFLLPQEATPVLLNGYGML